MPFDVELSFTGLGVALIRSTKKRSPEPEKIEFLLVHTLHTGRLHEMEPHLPRLWFRFEDLMEPENRIFPNARVGADGIPLVELDINTRSFAITAQSTSKNQVTWASNSSAVEPGENAPIDAWDWIPDIGDHFGINSFVLPESADGPKIYATRIELPPGKLTSRYLLLNRDFGRAKWTFGGMGPARVLAEQAVWTGRVNNFEIDIQGIPKLKFDAKVREARGEPTLVKLALTNLPRDGESGRFNDPRHFGHFQIIGGAGAPKPREIKRENGSGGPITSQGACPPVRKEIISA